MIMADSLKKIADEVTETKINIKNDQFLKNLETDMVAHANNGKYSIEIFETVDQRVIDYLRSIGYSVRNYYDEYDDMDVYVISWGD
jgi:bisphosphoglycerate-independent phosphoglycerate mutase (AlkP superfamily)